MLFAPVHGGCYIISSVGIEYSMWFERNVVYSVCIRFECSGRVTDGFPKKKWIGLSSIQFFFGFLEFFKLCKAPKERNNRDDKYHRELQQL